MTIIVADTICGLPRKFLEERCIPLVPQIVTFLSKLQASATLPKPAALSVRRRSKRRILLLS